jgi:hypothetical protein
MTLNQTIHIHHYTKAPINASIKHTVPPSTPSIATVRGLLLSTFQFQWPHNLRNNFFSHFSQTILNNWLQNKHKMCICLTDNQICPADRGMNRFFSMRGENVMLGCKLMYSSHLFCFSMRSAQQNLFITWQRYLLCFINHIQTEDSVIDINWNKTCSNMIFLTLWTLAILIMCTCDLVTSSISW